jgi:hypothetical protein
MRCKIGDGHLADCSESPWLYCASIRTPGALAGGPHFRLHCIGGGTNSGGYLYGTAASSKTVFRLTLDGAFTPIEAVLPGSASALIQASNGSFYGTISSCIDTFYSNGDDAGIVFELTLDQNGD